MRAAGWMLVGLGGIAVVGSLLLVALGVAPDVLAWWERSQGLAIMDPTTGTDVMLEHAIARGRSIASVGACGLSAALLCGAGGIAMLREHRRRA